MFSILKKEIISYLSSLVAYVTIGVFLLVLGLFLWVFPESSILNYGYAGLDSLFSTAPYLFMFLIPAITMRVLAEERKEGTFELLLTRPLTSWQIVMGKYLACVILVLFALPPTLVYYYSVYTLGTPQGNIDTGGVIGSYIGVFLLGAAFTAIGLFASSITKNQIIAFTIAVFLCFFVFSGFDSLSTLLSLQNLDLDRLGITAHYQSISRGVLDTRDLIYFIIITGIFLGLTLLAVVKQKQKNLDLKVIGIVAGAFLLLAIISVFTFTRFDFTKEKRYTLSPISRNIMDTLSRPVKVTVYLQTDNLPGGMKRLQAATRDMLLDLQAYSHGKLIFNFTDPLKGLSADEQNKTLEDLRSQGVEASNLSIKTDDGLTQKLIVPGAIVACGDKTMGVNLLQTRVGTSDDEALNNSIQNLEYAFTSAIKKTTNGGKLFVGFSEGHNELTNRQLADAIHTLADGYEVARVDLQKVRFDGLKRLSLLVIAKPDRPFTELEKFKIDQYIMQGGRVLWSIDAVSAEMDSLRGHGNQYLAFPKQLNLDDQLFRYGVRINPEIIADMNCAQIPLATGTVGGQPQYQMVPWLFYPIFMPLSTHPIVRNLDGIYSEFANTMDTLSLAGVRKTVLLTTSPFNQKMTAPHTISLQAVEQEPDPKSFQSPPKTVAVLLEGRFTSAFANRPIPAGFEGNIKVTPLSQPTKMIVISDGDIFKNQVAQDGSPYPLGYDHYTRKSYGNKTLLLNMADYLADESGLISLRSKEVKLRLLNRARLRGDKLFWQVLNTTAPLVMVLIFAIFQHYLRKRKYAM